jgi:hypothetical protein
MLFMELRTIGNFAKCPQVRGLLTDSKLCRQQAEVIQNHENVHVRSIGEGETRNRKCKRLKLGGGQTTVQVIKLPL